MTDRDAGPPQTAFSWAALQAAQRASGGLYHEFLRSSSLSTGLYVLPVGADDPQRPHSEDEVYVLMAGGAKFTAGEESREVRAGDILYVAAGVPHRFHDITDELRIIVIFAPPEGSLGTDGPRGVTTA
jgi:mannose-6-phosphate isomerase-like protein (cupin superfamily)